MLFTTRIKASPGMIVGQTVVLFKDAKEVGTAKITKIDQDSVEVVSDLDLSSDLIRSSISMSSEVKLLKTHKCFVCGQEMTFRKGYAKTGMCGPCVTGEAETLQEKGRTW